MSDVWKFGQLGWWSSFYGLDFCDVARFFIKLDEGFYLCSFCVLAWGVWNDRNKWVFEKVQKSPERIRAKAKVYIEAFSSVHGCFSSSPVTSDK